MDPNPKPFARVKWGQILSFIGAGLLIFEAFEKGPGPGRHDAIQVAGMLMVLGLAFRALDIWQAKK